LFSFFFFSSRRRHTRSDRDWSSDVCSSDLPLQTAGLRREFDLIHGLAIPGVSEAYALEAHRDRVALILADIGGSTLKDLIVKGRSEERRVGKEGRTRWAACP